MTAVLGFVIFGRSAPRSQRAEPYVRSSVSYAPMPTPLSVPAFAGIANAPLPAPPLEEARTAPPLEEARTAPPFEDVQETIVWVNTRTGVVHERGTRWFGKTAEGKYVSKRSLASGSDLAELSPAA